MLKRCFIVFVAWWGTAAYAQEMPMKTLSLEDMSAFKPQAGNWQIVGDVVMNPTIDVHPEEKPAEKSTKKGKKSKEVVKEKPKAVTFQPGKGILLNLSDESKKDNLVSAFEHGDIELELEVMLPKGSNSGIYLQGRYEVQLYDSWGVKNPKFSDIGGIYRNWEKEPGKIYMGKAPLQNPAKAPGLWQKMKISFRAPRFDAAGNKIANARFVSVELNGVRIHDNVEVPLPTGGPVQNNEKPTGPIMIQGDHGAVAFRNMKYQMMKELNVSIGDVSFKTYTGKFNEIADFISAKPTKTGTSKDLTCEVLDEENNYGVTYTGNITVLEDNTYQVNLVYTGGTKLVINGQTLVDDQQPDARDRRSATIALKAGTHPFEIINFKDASWMPPRLGLSVRAPGTYPKILNAYNSNPPDDEPTSPILIQVGSEPRLLRAFVDFKGDHRKRLTHTIGVGDPSGIHYAYDLESGNLACVWRGDFVDATPMWHDRGDGSFHPQGAVQFLFVNQPLAFLATPADPFPIMVKQDEFRTKGYAIDEASGRPVFNYIYQGLEVSDKVYPSDNNRMITHEVVIKNRGTKTGLYYKLAEGSSIIPMPDGSYAVDDKQYYIKPTSPVSVRDVNGKKELVTTVDGSTVNYSIIW